MNKWSFLRLAAGGGGGGVICKKQQQQLFMLANGPSVCFSGEKSSCVIECMNKSTECIDRTCKNISWGRKVKRKEEKKKKEAEPGILDNHITPPMAFCQSSWLGRWNWLESHPPQGRGGKLKSRRKAHGSRQEVSVDFIRRGCTQRLPECCCWPELLTLVIPYFSRSGLSEGEEGKSNWSEWWRRFGFWCCITHQTGPIWAQCCLRPDSCVLLQTLIVAMLCVLVQHLFYLFRGYKNKIRETSFQLCCPHGMK